MKKLIFAFWALVVLSSCTQENASIVTPMPAVYPSPVASEQAPEPTEFKYIEAPITRESASEGMTKLKQTDCFFLSENDADTLTLYTSSQRDESGALMADDSADYLLELSTPDGDIYTLFDASVSNGAVYFDVVEYDEVPYIIVRNISSAGDYSEVFCVRDKSVFKTNSLDLNTLKEKYTNLIYSSVPSYR